MDLIDIVLARGGDSGGGGGGDSIFFDLTFDEEAGHYDKTWQEAADAIAGNKIVRAMLVLHREDNPSVVTVASAFLYVTADTFGTGDPAYALWRIGTEYGDPSLIADTADGYLRDYEP